MDASLRPKQKQKTFEIIAHKNEVSNEKTNSEALLLGYRSTYLNIALVTVIK